MQNLKKILFVAVAVGSVGAMMAVAAWAAADKVTICHKEVKKGVTSATTMQVAQSAVSAHLAHGDSLGACTVSPSN